MNDACNRCTSPVVSSSSINASVKSNGVYQLTLDKQQNAVITRQASHFQLSQVEWIARLACCFININLRRAIQVQMKFYYQFQGRQFFSVFTSGCNNRDNMYNTTTTIVTSKISIKTNVADNQFRCVVRRGQKLSLFNFLF